MRKISILFIFLAIAGSFFACNAEENTVKMSSSMDSNNILKTENNLALIDIPGIEIAIVPNFNRDNTFTEYYIFEYDILNENFFDVSAVKEASFLEASTDYVKLMVNSQVITFTIDSNYVNSNEIIFYGNGLAHKTSDKYELIDIGDTEILDLSEVITYNNQTYGASMTCHSGGAGASECSSESSGYGGNCSVKCNAGYYACCDDTVNKCKCIASTPTTGKPPRKLVKHVPFM